LAATAAGEATAPVSGALLKCCELLDGLADRLHRDVGREVGRELVVDRPPDRAATLKARSAVAQSAISAAMAQARELSSVVSAHLPTGAADPAAAAAAEQALRTARDRLSSTIAEGRAMGLGGYRLAAAERQRREMHEIIQELRGSVRVYCRVRPMSARERRAGETEVLSVRGGASVVVAGHADEAFDFDAVLTPGTQEQVFEEARDLAQSALDGHNVTMLCYGQTGTGKTYTLYGTLEEEGLALRMLRELFSLLGDRQLSVSGSFVELCGDRLVDLLAPVPASSSGRRQQGFGPGLRDAAGADVQSLTEWPLESLVEAKALLDAGLSRRVVAAHTLNAQSSRSHAFLTVQVAGAKLVFCDLAGFERLKRTEVTDRAAREAIHTNRSLTALGDVIDAIVRRRKHIPYRNHKMTRILQDSLGGSAKALIFVNCSPASGSAHETATALRFATRAREVRNTAARARGDAEI